MRKVFELFNDISKIKTYFFN